MKKFEKDFINQALEELKFNELTDVQLKVIPFLENKRDVIVEANTGSGKTHAFLLPIFEALDEDLAEVQAVILAPTRELAKQILDFALAVSKHSEKEITIDLYVGGVNRNDIIHKISKRTPQIVIGTPGRIIDLVVKENILKVHTAKYFIIDEADMTLDKNFIEEMSFILDVLDKTAVKAVFSATIPEYLKPFLKKYLDDPAVIDVHPQEVSSLNIKHLFVKTREQKRFNTLEKIFNTINPYLAIIFCNTKESADEVFAWMKEHTKSVTLIHGGLDYRKRKQLKKRIDKLEFQYIVATDIISRGIDIEGISHIINYELPRDNEFYIHRTGRTGRVDFDGIALSLYEFTDNSYMDKLEKKGISSKYVEIVNDEIVDAVMRNKRSNRERKENEIDREAKLNIRKPKKVKPGYKKKNQERLNKEKKKLLRKRK
ncbi:MAG: DEAD/DEAH box helicase [Tenericutes bacterium]|nr:DEAD/DEAH box helicase [Mycoplasmatota bacterium]